MVSVSCPTRSVNGSEIAAYIWPAFAPLRLGFLLRARLSTEMAQLKRSAGTSLPDVAFFVCIYLSSQILC